jgi:ABC-2 type transport system ATP-binding protein
LLLLDEPTTGLDPVARTEFNELVQLMVRERGITAFLSSHLVDEVQDIADRVGIIQAGRMSFEGEVPVLRARVRRVRSLEPLALSSGFARVYGEIWQADPELWAAEAWPEGTEIEQLSLEDIFVAFARSSGSTTQQNNGPQRTDGA